MQVSLGPGHIVLDGDPDPSTKGTQPPVFGPYLLWPNGWMDQDATWYGGRPLPKRHYVRWRPSSPLEKGGTVPPIFGPCLLWPNGCMDEDETSHAGRPRSQPHCVRWGLSTAPNFRSMSIVAKWLDASDATWYGGRARPRPHCARWGPPPKKETKPQNFGPMFIVAKRLDGSR